MPNKHNALNRGDKVRSFKFTEYSRVRVSSHLEQPSDAVLRVEALESLCGELYQVLGNAGASEQVLDKVWAAANGDQIPEVSLLPSKPMDFEEVRKRQETIDQIVTFLAPRLGQIGGSRSTKAKREAARLNGRKGGRPRKNAAGV